VTAAALEQPPVPVNAEPALDSIVRAYRIDRSFDNIDPEDLPDGKTAEDMESAYDVGPAWYAEKHAHQVWPHVDEWLKEVPGCDVTVQIVDVQWVVWRDEMLGESDEVSRS
jgi:hypothetical protein